MEVPGKTEQRRLGEDRTIRTELVEGIARVIARILAVASYASDLGPPYALY